MNFIVLFQTDLKDIGDRWLPQDVNKGKCEYVSSIFNLIKIRSSIHSSFFLLLLQEDLKKPRLGSPPSDLCILIFMLCFSQSEHVLLMIFWESKLKKTPQNMEYVGRCDEAFENTLNLLVLASLRRSKCAHTCMHVHNVRDLLVC
jgi:hypothetical protein